MALVLKDRVKESSTSSGTGNITLAGAFTGYQTFASAIASGSTVYYTIHNTTSPNDTEWEVGVGTFTSPSTLSRDTVLSSSNSGNLVSFSTASILEVFVTQPAEEAVYINQATGKVEAFGNGTNSISFSTVVADTVTLTAGTISTNAANATDIVNKQYVDGIVAAGVHYHQPVLVESPTALNATYNQPGGAGNGVGATLTNAGANVALVIDGVTLSNTARVLVYTQSNAVQNGVYTVTNPGNSSVQWVLTRATDADTYVIDSPTGLSEGSTFFVQTGDTGAGETYTCNTPGTITFGTTNITFSQISSAQIYSAGTGLSLTNTTFSIANTTVVSGLYGDSANVSVIEVNAQGQLISAANSAINVSNITVGTLSNDRTTASTSNGANTIVLRDASGNFTANTINATTINATNITANAAGLTDINASNITSGTIANARTTGSTSNSASTLVLRDANGNFGSNVISASSFSGDGTAITAINASNISSGTIANARTTAASANGASTIVQRDSGGNFSANTVTAAVIGDISGGSNINASNISSGTIANARTTASSSNGASTIVLRDAGGAFAAGSITATSLSGNGSAITAINASAITTGTIDNARTTASSANGASTIVARDAGGNFSANTITATTFSGAHSGNGASLTDINASNITSGTISNARTTAASANGASTIVARDASGNFTANAITTTSISGNGVALTAINASNITSGTIANARTTASDANGASTIVSRDASGNFSGNILNGQSFRLQDGATQTGYLIKYKTLAGTGTDNSTTLFAETGLGIKFAVNGSATVVGDISSSGVFTINGSGINSINASNISSGTIANARTTASSANGASTIVSRDASGNFVANSGTFNGTVWGTNVVAGTTSALSSTGTLAVYRSASPFISFHDGTTARTSYIQEAAGRFYFGETDYTETEGSFRAPIFYDSNNTAYYLDPNSLVSGIFAGSLGVKNTSPVNSNWGTSTTTGQVSVYGSAYGVVNIRGDNGGARTYSMGVGDNNFYMCYDNTAARHNITVNSSGNVTMPVAVYTPIVYDNDNSGFYLDPNGTSVLNVVTSPSTAKAWANFNGNAGTVRTSRNVSSITVNATGQYTINFSSALADADYAALASCKKEDNNAGYQIVMLGRASDTYTSSGFTVRTIFDNASQGGNFLCNIAVFR